MDSRVFHSLHSQELVMLLKTGGIGVIPTDTIYGISTSALLPKAIERMYDIRNRDRFKRFIILIASIDDLDLFGIGINEHTRKELNRIWPAPVSVVLRYRNKKYAYLHRGAGENAFRVPAWAPLRALLKKTGPLVTTSVNPGEGIAPALSIREAKKYFGNTLDFYVDTGTRKGTPSTLLQHTNKGFELLRRGACSTEFQGRVYDVVRAIPKGTVMTYKEVAQKAGRSGAYRAVGTLLSKNYDPDIPCHRVIRSDGNLGEYNRGSETKRIILKEEKAGI